MNRKAILETIDDIERTVINTVGETDNHDLRWMAGCDIPDMCNRLRSELVPWYRRLWWKLQFNWRRTWGIEDEIPF